MSPKAAAATDVAASVRELQQARVPQYWQYLLVWDIYYLGWLWSSCCKLVSQQHAALLF
jgi:hypothetical protein